MHLLRYASESRKPSQCIKIGNACIKIGNACIEIGNSVRKCKSIGYSSSQSIKIWNVSFSALCDNFRHCETISKKFLLQRRPPRIIITPVDILLRVRILFLLKAM